MKTIEFQFWITVAAKRMPGAWWRAGRMVMSRKKPKRTSADCVNLQVILAIPETYFAQPELSAKIDIPDVGPGREEIVVKMKDRIAQEAKAKFGVTVSFQDESA